MNLILHLVKLILTMVQVIKILYFHLLQKIILKIILVSLYFGIVYYNFLHTIVNVVAKLHQNDILLKWPYFQSLCYVKTIIDYNGFLNRNSTKDRKEIF